MRRDAKLGLALGMLVVGFATAFCFPRQPEFAPWLTHAEPTPIADSELEFLPIRAYQPAPAEAAPSLSSPIENSPTTATSDVPLAIGAVGPPPAEQLSTKAEPATASSDLAIPGRATAVETPRSPADHGSVSGEQTYVIRPGDTLTGISMRFFGTTQRFQRIYDRNRDRLRSENDLRVGTEIIIPANSASDVPLVRTEAASPALEADVTPVPQVGGNDNSQIPTTRFERTAGAPFLNDLPRQR